MKVLFLFPYPLASAPSQRFRFEQYFEYLGKHGIEITTQSFWNEKGWRILYQRGRFLSKIYFFLAGCMKRVTMLVGIRRFDFVFLHREAVPVGPPLIEWLIARVFGKRLIYDFDDAIWMPNTSQENILVAGIKWHNKVGMICRWSHRVSCGNEYLASYARQFNADVRVVPTTLETRHHHNPSGHAKPTTNGIVVGWTGTHSTLPYLQPLLSVLRSLSLNHPDVEILVIADRKPDWELPHLRFVPWSASTEIADLMQISVGVMPLPDEPWANGKCGLKALQFMSLEIPVLVSPVGVNKILVEPGISGYWCTSTKDWEEHLEFLVGNAEARHRLGVAGRQRVIAHYSVEAVCSRYLSLFE